MGKPAKHWPFPRRIWKDRPDGERAREDAAGTGRLGRNDRFGACLGIATQRAGAILAAVQWEAPPARQQHQPSTWPGAGQSQAAAAASKQLGSTAHTTTTTTTRSVDVVQHKARARARKGVGWQE
ncbi:hypothetical protein MAPG_06370 [Magnaporthiopsis poae ATCC 64411]|uniref:Uncharacterized protein n=1 Tax=Magnaporthiopsis poae (strain ATCC 64411 / 73-15) TaxID=644358 RepID=A0A0C4E1U9_MAGP6|nr:hypothetical protein MAPG_06370 [Magnaporthiopsis poae ATCC 64411]